VIDRFQKGNYNVLIAASIGEEGLDIDDINLIICYNTSNSPIRMLQRMGRTGRKRKGPIVLLLTKGLEDRKYRQAFVLPRATRDGLRSRPGILRAGPMYPPIKRNAYLPPPQARDSLVRACA
ncbi:LOW QUALITY PROTEIN: P-loop containing nucleoside triphosphate hydrolase protein, partial [Jimgerdemannia flammicorona]